MGAGTAKYISPNHRFHPAPGVQSSHRVFSFEIWSFKYLDLFLKIYYSSRVWKLQFWHTYARGDFCQGHLYPIDSSNPWDFCHGMQLLQGKVDFQMEKLGLALELVVCFHFWTHWQALLSLCGNTKWHIMFIPKVDTGCTKSMVIGLLKSKLWHQKRRSIYFMGVIRSEPLYLMHLSFQ